MWVLSIYVERGIQCQIIIILLLEKHVNLWSSRKLHVSACCDMCYCAQSEWNFLSMIKNHDTFGHVEQLKLKRIF